MDREPKNIPLTGLFPVPARLADAPVEARAMFWKLIGAEALKLKQREVLAGIDRFGQPFLPVKRKWGNPTPLIPHGESSRTYRLLTFNSSARGATLFWRSGGGRTSWPTILGYHAYKHGARSLPVRDEIGLSPKSVEGLVAQSEMWEAGFEAGLKMRKASIERPTRFPTSKAAYERQLAEALARGVGQVREQARTGKREIGPPEPKTQPKPKPHPKPKPAPQPTLRISQSEDRMLMKEADRLTREAQEESRKIMEDARLAAIRKRHEEEEKKRGEEERKQVKEIEDRYRRMQAEQKAKAKQEQAERDRRAKEEAAARKRIQEAYREQQAKERAKPEPVIPPTPRPVAPRPAEVKVQEKLKAEAERKAETENKAKADVAPPKPDMVHLMARLHEAFEQEDIKAKGSNLVSLDKLKAYFPELTMQEFHDVVNRARRERLYSTETHEGTSGKLTEAMKQAAIREGQAAPKVYLSR